MIRKKLQVMIFLGLSAAALMAVISNWTACAIQDASEDRVKLAHFIKGHMDADMMHDAIHSDVLEALREAQQYNTAGVEAARNDLREHAQQMRESIEKNRQLELPVDITEALEKTMPAIEAYIASGDQVIEEASKDPLAAERTYVSFKQQFKHLEETMEVISNLAEQQTVISNDAAEAVEARSNMMLMGTTALMLLSLAGMALVIFKSLLNPLQDSIQAMLQLSQGNLTADIVGTERKDEIGSMMRAMSVFKENALKTKNMDQERVAAEARAQDEKKQAMQELAQRFEQRVQGIIASVASASTQLLQTAQGMSDVIGEANHKAESVARSADATTGNVQTVASAAEEMTASVKEISSQVNKSTQVVADTVSKAEHADSSAKELEGAAQQIGHVVQLIQDIAEQINLLALNATIESARAGDAGKGFAVVASEVKNLATQTTKATEEIASQIEGIQVISKSVVEALNGIKKSIDHVSEYAGGIASAVEEQSAVTDEIAANMQTAAAGTNDIRMNINDVTTKANSAKMAATSVLEASRSLSREAETLSREVAEFLSEIRS